MKTVDQIIQQLEARLFDMEWIIKDAQKAKDKRKERIYTDNYYQLKAIVEWSKK